MKLRNCCISLLLLALTSLAAAQTCPGGVLTASNNWCGSYTAADSNCRSGLSTGSCGVHSNVGFISQTGGTGTTSITAPEIDSVWSLGTAGPDVVPNAAIGLNQYLEFANNRVQGYTRSGVPIFIDSATFPTFRPQPANTPWNSNQNCGQETVDYNMSYDHRNEIWVLAGTSKKLGTTYNNITNGVLCITVSTQDNLLPSSCISSGLPCNTYWSTYGFDITALLPSIAGTDGTLFYDQPDYARFGTWIDDNYYVTFDLLDAENGQDGTNGNNNGIIHGFAVCRISGSTLRAGNKYNGGTTPPVTCYDRLNASWDSGGFAQIHTLLPADVQNSAAPTNTEGEYFLATVSPFVSSAPCVPSSTQPCTSDQLAYWTWTTVTSESLPYYITTNTSFIPGCYYTGSGRPYGNTKCIPEPGPGTQVDSVGDRLMSPLAYRYVTGCDEGSTFAASCEYLAVTQTIQEDQNWDSVHNRYENTATGIRYYTVIASTPTIAPRILYEGDFFDTTGNLFYWMPSNAIDKNQVVGYTFNIGNGSSTYCSMSPCYPSVYADTLDAAGATGTLTSVQTGSASITDSANQSWGEYVSMSMDPSDDLTFWGVGEYLTTTESNCHSGGGSSNRCEWLTTIFNCQKGSGVCP